LARKTCAIEKHHIIPLFEGGLDEIENFIYLTIKEHTIAHWLRWKAYNKVQDKLAWAGRAGESAEVYRLKMLVIQLRRAEDKIAGLRMFDPEWQSIMGKKGGLLGGSANTTAQFLARQTVGLLYGRHTGMGNQSSSLQEFLQYFVIWAYCPTKTRTQEFFCMTGPSPAFADVCRLLNFYIPGAIKSFASFSKLWKNERNQMYGWRVEAKLTRSEVRAGYQKFIQNHPDSILYVTSEIMVKLNEIP